MIVILALLSLMLIYVGANLKTLHILKREVALIEAKQLQRWQLPPNRVSPSLDPRTASTNAIPQEPPPTDPQP